MVKHYRLEALRTHNLPKRAPADPKYKKQAQKEELQDQDRPPNNLNRAIWQHFSKIMMLTIQVNAVEFIILIDFKSF